MATPETSEGSTLPPTEQTTTEEEKPRSEPLDSWQKWIIVIGVFTLLALIIAIVGLVLGAIVDSDENSTSNTAVYSNEQDVICNVAGGTTGTAPVTINIKRLGDQVFVSWPYFTGIISTSGPVILTSQTGQNPLPSWALPFNSGSAISFQVYAPTVIASNTTPTVYFGPSYMSVSSQPAGTIQFFGWTGTYTSAVFGGGSFPVGNYTIYPSTASYSATS